MHLLALTGWFLSLAASLPRSGGFPEGQAAITDLLLQDSPALRWETYPLVRDLLRALPEDVRLWVAVGEPAQLAGAHYLLAEAGVDPARARVFATGQGLSVWARDDLVVVEREGTLRLLSPSGEPDTEDEGADERVAHALSGRIAGARAVRVPWSVDGGNVLFSADLALVGANVLDPPEDGEPDPRTTLAADLEAAFGVRVLFVGRDVELPHEHLDMFLTVVGERRVLLGDPAWGARFLEEWRATGLHENVLPAFDDWTAREQQARTASYEAVARELRAGGFVVDRLPILHGEGGAILTWNNAVLERRGAERRAYVPAYDLPGIDRAAHQAYRECGFRVFPVDAARLIHRGGAVRCVTNVLGWREEPVAPPAAERESPGR